LFNYICLIGNKCSSKFYTTASSREETPFEEPPFEGGPNRQESFCLLDSDKCKEDLKSFNVKTDCEGNNLRTEVINTELSDSSLTVISSIKSRDFDYKVSCVDGNLKSKLVDIERSDGSLTTVSPLSSSNFDYKVSCANLESKLVDSERSDGSLTTVSPLSSSSFDLPSKSTQINTQYKSNSFELEGFETKRQVLSLLSRFEIWL